MTPDHSGDYDPLPEADDLPGRLAMGLDCLGKLGALIAAIPAGPLGLDRPVRIEDIAPDGLTWLVMQFFTPEELEAIGTYTAWTKKAHFTQEDLEQISREFRP